jgi:hypothetical protein
MQGSTVLCYFSSKAVISNFFYVAPLLKYKKYFVHHTQLDVQRIKSTVPSVKVGWAYFRQGDSSYGGVLMQQSAIHFQAEGGCSMFI